MKREFKFKVWLASINKMTRSHSLQDMTRVLRDDVSENELLLQYTGLKDKHGNEIYEGDIVYVPSLGFGNMLVKFHRGAFLFYQHEEGKGMRGYRLRYWDESEIKGNIYENPEMWVMEKELEKSF